MLEIGLLGPLEVRDGERVLTPRRQKQRALLAALALRPGRIVSADTLVDELWGERSPKTARHALENYVSELRKTLGRETIATVRGGYELRVEPVQVDVTRFERQVAEARQAMAEERSEKLRSALSLFRGAPLADLSFEPFAQGESARIEELALRAREELVDAELELGRHADVVGVLEPLVAEYPYREGLRARLMLALYRSGRQAEALATYQDARRLLAEELGLDPGAELQDLELAILRQDYNLRSPPMPATTAVATPTHGRGAVRKTVTALFAELANLAAAADRLDPEPLRALLDRYRSLLRDSVVRHGGICGAVAGDTALAVFGAPAAHEDDAERAVRAAAELREGVGVLNDGLLPEAGIFLEVRMGVSTGEVLVVQGADDLATGRAVALAEQLARDARPGQIVLDETTLDRVRHTVDAEPVTVERPAQGFRLVEIRSDAYERPLRLDSPLVGRRHELSSLLGAFEAVATQPGARLYTLLGAAGIGKSRLVSEFVDHLADVACVLRGRCLPYGDAIPLWPLLEALRDAPVEEGVGATASSIATQLARLSNERPVVLVLDDLHWADLALLELLEDLVGQLPSASILLLCVARPELIELQPDWGLEAGSTRLSLDPLSEVESERLLDNLLGESDLPDPVRDHIIRSGDGNPLFVEELLATLVDREILRREQGRWTTTEISAIPTPATIQALITARVDRLPAAERAVLELASVQGKSFGKAVVAELAPPELARELDIHLTSLIGKELVRPGDEDFVFRHQVIRDVAYSSMPMQVRIELHERLAHWLATSPAERELADYHLEQARRFEADLRPVQPA